MIHVELKDGKVLEVESGISVLDLAKQISEGLARMATAGKVDEKVVDLRYVLEKDCKVEILTFENDLEGKKAYWHTTSHIMAQAVKRVVPSAKLAIGPSIDEGFYYDFDVEQPFTEEDKQKIEEEMKKIIKEDLPIERFVLPRDEAIALMKKMEEPYKVELIEDLPEGEEISFYRQGDFTDLCAGPHLTSTGKVKCIKLLSSSGAYWRGSEKNKMLQRIYGVSFPKASQLEEHLALLEEAKTLALTSHNQVDINISSNQISYSQGNKSRTLLLNFSYYFKYYYDFHFNKNGNISSGGRIELGNTNEIKTIILNVGSGAFYVR